MNTVKNLTFFVLTALVVSPTAYGMEWLFGKSEQKTVTQKIVRAVANRSVLVATGTLVTVGTAYVVRRRKAVQTPANQQAPAAQESIFSKAKNKASGMLTSAIECVDKLTKEYPRVAQAGKYVGAGVGVLAAGSSAYYCRNGLKEAAQAAADLLNEHKKELGTGVATAVVLGGTALVAKKNGLLGKKELTPKQKFMNLLTQMANGADNRAAIECVLLSRNDAGLTAAVNNEFFPALEVYRAAVEAQTKYTGEDKKAELTKAVETAKTKLDAAIDTVQYVVNCIRIF